MAPIMVLPTCSEDAMVEVVPSREGGEKVGGRGSCSVMFLAGEEI